MSLLIDFGKIIDKAQQDIDDETDSIMPENEIIDAPINDTNSIGE